MVHTILYFNNLQHASFSTSDQYIPFWFSELAALGIEMESKDLNDMSVAIAVLYRPVYKTFSKNLVFTGQVTYFHIAGLIGAMFEVRLLGSNANRCARVNDERERSHFDIEEISRMGSGKTTGEIHRDNTFPGNYTSNHQKQLLQLQQETHQIQPMNKMGYTMNRSRVRVGPSFSMRPTKLL
jgi:hypothetical protein